MNTKVFPGDEGARKRWNGWGKHAAASPAVAAYEQHLMLAEKKMLLTVMMQFAADTLGALSPAMKRQTTQPTVAQTQRGKRVSMNQ
jgi:hypothetical protein